MDTELSNLGIEANRHGRINRLHVAGVVSGVDRGHHYVIMLFIKRQGTEST